MKVQDRRIRDAPPAEGADPAGGPRPAWTDEGPEVTGGWTAPGAAPPPEPRDQPEPYSPPLPHSPSELNSPIDPHSNWGLAYPGYDTSYAVLVPRPPRPASLIVAFGLTYPGLALSFLQWIVIANYLWVNRGGTVPSDSGGTGANLSPDS